MQTAGNGYGCILKTSVITKRQITNLVKLLWNWQVLKPKSTRTRRRRCTRKTLCQKPLTAGNIIITINTGFYRKKYHTVLHRYSPVLLWFRCSCCTYFMVCKNSYRIQIAIHRDVMFAYRGGLFVDDIIIYNSCYVLYA